MNRNIPNMSDDLLVKDLLGEVTPDEQQQVQEWITANEANLKHYEHLKLIWEESRKLETASTVDTNAAWQRFKDRTEKRQEIDETPVTISFPLRSWLRVAAILVLVLGGGLLYYFNAVGGQTIVAQSGEGTLVDTLSDGSVVTLNKNSSLSYPRQFEQGKRIVTLKGEAFFSVTPDKKRPFIIHSGEADIKVVGTTFNVKNTPGKTEIIVETGIVEVAKKKQIIKVLPHEVATVLQEQAEPVKQSNSDELYGYYHTKEFVCNGTSLGQLTNTLNEAFNVHIVITNEKVQSLQLTTTFHNEPLNDILAVICETFDLKTERQGGDIYLNQR